MVLPTVFKFNIPKIEKKTFLTLSHRWDSKIQDSVITLGGDLLDDLLNHCADGYSIHYIGDLTKLVMLYFTVFFLFFYYFLNHHRGNPPVFLVRTYSLKTITCETKAVFQGS